MAISYILGFNPIWYIADNVGKPLGGGYLATYSSLNPTVQKFVFEDPAGIFPYPYVPIPNTNLMGILINENGQQGPFYFKFDSANPTDLYFLETYDSAGNLVWTDQNYIPGTGGGGSITEAINFQNLITNNVFWRNTGSTPNPIVQNVTTLAPGCHAALAPTTSNAGPDIQFIKNNTSATDHITFPFFALGSQPLTGDVTPVQYINYTCSIAGAGETQKCVQFPVCAKVQNFTNLTVSGYIWARGNSGTTTLQLNWFTFYGDGGGAPPIGGNAITPITTLTLTNAWAKYAFTTSVPNVTGATLGNCFNDGLFFQVQYPFTATCNIDFIKPSLFLGALTPTADFMLNDDIDGVLNVPKTGAIRTTMNLVADVGWVLLNDGTIGDASSNATTRANNDTFPLFNLIYTATASNPTFCPLFDSAGNPIARSGSAITDYIAHSRLSLPLSKGRALSNIGIPSSGGSGTNWAVAQASGEENHVLTVGELAAHTHGTGVGGASFVVSGGLAAFQASGANVQGQLAATTGSTGSSTGHNTIQPTQYQNFEIKL